MYFPLEIFIIRFSLVNVARVYNIVMVNKELCRDNKRRQSYCQLVLVKIFRFEFISRYWFREYVYSHGNVNSNTLFNCYTLDNVKRYYFHLGLSYLQLYLCKSKTRNVQFSRCRRCHHLPDICCWLHY